MSLWKKALLAGVAATVLLAWSGIGFAQEEGAAGAAGAAGGGRPRMDPAQMRQRALDRTKEALGVTEEQWAVMKPKLEKIATIQGEMLGGRSGMGRAPEVEGEEPSPLRKASQELRSVLGDAHNGMPVTPEQIKEKLTAYREARDKARQELAAVQEELRALLTVEQEATLVSRGTLE